MAPVTVGAPTTVVAAACAFEEFSADAVPAARDVNGSRGFVSFGGRLPAAGVRRPVDLFRRWWRALVHPAQSVLRTGARSFQRLHRHVGVVFNLARDILGKRAENGSVTNPTRLSSHGNGGAVPTTGDLITDAGGYWAVWTEQVGPGR